MMTQQTIACDINMMDTDLNVLRQGCLLEGSACKIQLLQNCRSEY